MEMELMNPEVQRKASMTDAILARAQSLVVASAEDERHAAAGLIKVKSLSSELTEIRMTMTRPLDESKKAIMDFFRVPLDRLVAAEKCVKEKMLQYRREEDARQAEAQALANEAARKERERLEAEAAKLQAKGRSEQAEAKREIAQTIIAPMVAPAPPPPRGISTRASYRAVVMDIRALARAVLDGSVPENCIEANMPILNGLARTLKESMHYPGVEVVRDEILAAPTKPRTENI